MVIEGFEDFKLSKFAEEFIKKHSSSPFFRLLEQFHLQRGEFLFLFIFKANQTFTTTAVKLRVSAGRLGKSTGAVFCSDDIG
jgi:hypothetical protein